MVENKTSDSFPLERLAMYLSASSGYADLGMVRESTAELNALPDRFQHRPDVLRLRIENFMRKGKWAPALTISRKLCRLAPKSVVGFLHGGSCLRMMGKIEKAKKTFLRGPRATILKEPIYHYNMGCCDALLGNIDQALENLEKSFKMDRSYRDLAKRDPDLKSIQHRI